jgi:hypothetical protein
MIGFMMQMNALALWIVDCGFVVFDQKQVVFTKYAFYQVCVTNKTV